MVPRVTYFCCGACSVEESCSAEAVCCWGIGRCGAANFGFCFGAAGSVRELVGLTDAFFSAGIGRCGAANFGFCFGAADSVRGSVALADSFFSTIKPTLLLISNA